MNDITKRFDSKWKITNAEQMKSICFAFVFYSFHFIGIAVVRIISPFQLDAVHNHLLVCECSIVMQQIVLIIIACRLSVLVFCSFSTDFHYSLLMTNRSIFFFSSRTNSKWAVALFCYHWQIMINGSNN